MTETRRSEGRLITLQFCTAMSNIPAGTPLGVQTGTNNIYTLGSGTTGFTNIANLGATFIGIADQNISAGQVLIPVWVEGVFELTAASNWTTAYAGDAVLADSGRVVTIGATGSGSPPIGSYIPATPGGTECSGRTVNVRIRPGVWNWNTYNVSDSEESGINGGAFPPQT